MIRFTDPRLYVKGTCAALAKDASTGDICYFSNKFQTANVQTSVQQGDIRAGIGNPIATMIPSDSGVTVNFTAADFSLWAKAAQVGASLSYNAPVMVSQNVTASGTSLTIDVTEGTPVAQLGFSAVQCYVQETGAKSPVATYGKAYALNAATGAVTGFTATSGKTYKVWYFVSKASAQVAKLNTIFNSKFVHFEAQIAVYANANGNNQGTQCGWLYVIIPRLKLGGDGGGITGDQTTPDTTSMSGQAVAFDDEVIGASENQTDLPNLAYYVYAPIDAMQNVTGLFVVGGAVTTPVSTDLTIPVYYAMDDHSGALANNADLKFTATGAPSGTTVGQNTGVIDAGATAGDFDVTVQYPKTGEAEFTCTIPVSITAS